MSDLKRLCGSGTLLSGLGVAAGVLVLLGVTTGCIGVGYSSSGGWFVWPGGLGLLVIVLLVVFLLRRRR